MFFIQRGLSLRSDDSAVPTQMNVVLAKKLTAHVRNQDVARSASGKYAGSCL
jgi:hypothetical protein